MSSTKLVFFGNEKLATGAAPTEPIIRQSLEAAGYDIEAIVTTKEIPAHDAQLAVLAAHGQILPPSVLDQFPLGIVNVHPSLLPLHRGPTPIEQAILDGDAKTGVTLMRVAAKMDSGPVYAQAIIPLTGDESKLELAERSQRLGAEMLVRILPQILDGSIEPTPQDSAIEPTYCRLIKKADGALDWAKPAQQLEREIRAYLGWPGSHGRLGSTDVIVTGAYSVPTNRSDGQPGDIEAMADIGIIMIECSRGTLCIERLKPAGKREMTAKEFLAGNRL